MRCLIWVSLGVLLSTGIALHQHEEHPGICNCNPEDNNTGPVCANNGVTFGSACEFRLKQGVKADLGIRCVGECPCDDTMLGLGIDCRASLAETSSTPGLEFCGTNSVTYNSENMFMCDQVQDPTLAIACPGTCPCHLSDCPRILSSHASSRTTPHTTPAPTTATPTRAFGPISNFTQILASAQPVIGFAQAIPSLTHQKALPSFVPHWQPLPTLPSPTSLPIPMPTVFHQTPPMLKHLPSPHISNAQMSSWQVPLESFASDLTQQPSFNMIPDTPRFSKGFNPLAEALRSVPFRLFRHLYIAISVAAEGMKQIPMQIAKNMQSRLPPYVREIPMQLAEAIQEAMTIHFDSLSKQVKDTVDSVRAIVDQDSM